MAAVVRAMQLALVLLIVPGKHAVVMAAEVVAVHADLEQHALMVIVFLVVVILHAQEALIAERAISVQVRGMVGVNLVKLVQEEPVFPVVVVIRVPLVVQVRVAVMPMVVEGLVLFRTAQPVKLVWVVSVLGKRHLVPAIKRVLRMDVLEWLSVLLVCFKVA